MDSEQEVDTHDNPPAKPELVVALVGRMGTELTPVCEAIKGESSKYGLQCFEVRVTGLLSYLDHTYAVEHSPLERRLESHIQACNQLRKDTDRNDIFSLLTANYIIANRDNIQNTDHLGSVYIVNQLKKPEEIEALQDIYGEALIVVSCHAPYEKRLDSLTNKFVAEHSDPTHQARWRALAEELIEKDEKELDSFGQNVSSAFPLADCIVDTCKEGATLSGISRLFRLIFGDPHLSPTFEEYGNNIAAQAALRSTDLSRQVGAAIFDSRKMILSMGSNEVPKAKGGTYWTGDEVDARDAHKGFDANTLRKRDLVIDVVERLQNQGVLKREWDKKSHEQLTSELLDGENKILERALVLNISEYGRALHAEMNAITDAARCNSNTQDATLFVTTFPCHNCAKHIVGSGIGQVYFLEPYPKSEAINLYDDSISVDAELPEKSKVRFDQFCGITDHIFYLFSKSKLKDHRGMLKEWKKETAQCMLRNLPHDFQLYEDIAVDLLEPALSAAGISIKPV